MKNWLGVEIGGTKQQIGVLDNDGNVLKVVSEKVVLRRGAPDILDWMLAQIPTLLAEFKIEGIGVGFGGVLDTSKGATICSVHVPGWKDFPIKNWFEENFNLPCVVVNDTVCGGYAELCYGTGKGCRIFAYTNIGTGCGGSLFIDKKTFDGIGYGGAYFGQTYVPDQKTGKNVRMETVCSGTGVRERLRQEGYIPETSSLYPIREKATFFELCHAAREKDGFALNEIDEWAERYAYALANIITILSPERIALGGGAANDADILIPAIYKHLEKLEFVSTVGRYDIVACDFLEEAVFVGAALYARDGFNIL